MTKKIALSGASLSALILAIAAPPPAAAQSFQGSGTVTSGSASIFNGTNTTNVLVFSDQVVIDWAASDVSGTGNVVFQPAGTTATFSESSINGTDYTVLNRIVPFDASGNPTNATIQFDGTVNSTLFGATGGNVWFYSPNGVILGSTAQFSVGGLVLTTNPIDTTGGLYGPSGEIRFAGPAGSLAPVTIQSGAQVNALRNAQVPTNAAYVALVAPRVEQAGTVRSDGSIAYVAAEVADIAINAGLFDINVTTATTDANGIVHTGTTGGSASTGAADVKTIYMVAMGKNDGLTMLLNGGIGYDAAAVATDDGSAVVLSAGHGIGFDTGAPLTATASITIGDAQFTSVTSATATDTITVAPTDTTLFERFATLDAISRVELNALAGAQIVANDTQGLPPDITFPPAYSLNVNAGFAGQGGTIAVNVDGGGALTTAGRLRLRATGDANVTAASSANGVGGTVAIGLVNGSIGTDALEIDASGIGQDSVSGTGGSGTGGTVNILSTSDLTATNLAITASGRGGSGDIGGNGLGGTIRLTASNGGAIAAPSMNLDATGNGGFALTQGGTGTGGMIDISVATGGTIGSGASVFGSASGIGGSGDAAGGDGIGGDVRVNDNGGLLDFTSVFLDANGSGSTSDGNGGNGFGGTVFVGLRGNDQSWGSLFLDANALGGESFGGGISGSATADLTQGVRLEITGVALNVANSVALHADAFVPVNGTTGSFGRAGRAVIDIKAGGSLSAGADVSVTGNADFSIEGLGSDPQFTPDMTGGNAALLIDNGSVSVPALSVEAFAVSLGALTDAGSATGGAAQVSVTNNGTLVVDSALGSSSLLSPGLFVIASASGAYETQIGSNFGTVVDGFAASAQGGTASLVLTGGTIDVADAVLVEAQGLGGPSNTIGGADSLGNGIGGSALVSIGGGTMTLGSTLEVLAEGIGGTIKGGATGGNGTGGLAALDASGGALIVNGSALTISADGTSNGVAPAESGSSGNAIGGAARLLGTGGNITVAGTTLVRARGTSGAAGISGVAGDGTGGLALLSSQNGGTVALNGPVSVLASGRGGAGTASGALGGNAFGGSASAGLSGTGAMTIAGDLLVDGSAIGGDNSIASLVQGTAQGGGAALVTEGGALQVTGNVTLDADATGGTSPGGTTSPTVAGFLKIGSATADPSGTLAVTGSLSATATGDSAPTSGQGFSLRTANSTLSVTGNTAIAVTGDAVFNILGSGSLDTGGTLTVTSDGQITGTGLLSSGGDTLVSGVAGINLASLDSGGSTGLSSANGSVTVANLLSTGPVTVSGLFVAIGSSGPLTFADADATAGNLTLAVTDDLVVATVDATGAVALASANGSVTMNGAVNGAGIAITSGANAAANAGLTSSGTLNVAAGGTFASPGAVTAAGNTSISADTGIALANLTSGGTTLLRSIGGPVAVAQLASGGLVTVLGQSVNIASTGALSFASANATGGNLVIQTGGNLTLGSGSATGATQLLAGGALNVANLTSGGIVTARGSSVGIASTGSLAFADADATSGNLTIQTQGDLGLATVDAPGSIVLASQAGSVSNSGAINGTGVAINAGQDIAANGNLASSGAMTLVAGRNIAINGGATSTGLLDIAAGQALAVNALASGSQIAARSQDIAIGAGGAVGQRGTTATVSFTNSNGGNTSYIGGGATTGGYSLDNGEFQRIFADNGIAFVVQSGTGAGEIQVGTLGLGFGTGQAIGSGGTLTLTTDGRLSVTGSVALATSSALDTLDLAAASVEVVTDTGSIAMRDTGANGLGLLRVNAGRFIAATSGTIAQISPSTDIDTINALMDEPGNGPAQGSLLAGSIEASVTEGIYVQNLGASTAFADRRGFTAGALAINTGGANTRIVVNGVIIDANGNAVTGLDTVPLIAINGEPATAGGSFDPFSTVNGCIIGLSCNLLETGTGLPRAKTDIETPVSSGDAAVELLSAPVIQMDTAIQELVSDPTLPLVDEPVTGVGNEDLWGGACSSEEENCSGGQTR